MVFSIGVLVGVAIAVIVVVIALRRGMIEWHSFSYPYSSGPSDPDL